MSTTKPKATKQGKGASSAEAAGGGVKGRAAKDAGPSGARASAARGGSVLGGEAGRVDPGAGGRQQRTVTESVKKKARPPSSRPAKIFSDEVLGNVKSKKTESLSDRVTKKPPAKKTESPSHRVTEKRTSSATKKPSSSVKKVDWELEVAPKKESPTNRAKRLREEGAAQSRLSDSAYQDAVAAELLDAQSGKPPKGTKHSTTSARYTPSAKSPAKKDREPSAPSRIHEPLPTSAITDMKERKPVAWITDDIIMEICGHVAEGTAIYKVLKSDPKRMPSREAFFRHVATNEKYSKLYAEACQLRGEYFADQISELADEARGQDSDEIQAIKLQVNTRQWLASRLLPKRYGDKMIVAGDADNPLVTQLVQGAEALKRKIKGEPE